MIIDQKIWIKIYAKWFNLLAVVTNFRGNSFIQSSLLLMEAMRITTEYYLISWYYIQNILKNISMQMSPIIYELWFIRHFYYSQIYWNLFQQAFPMPWMKIDQQHGVSLIGSADLGERRLHNNFSVGHSARAAQHSHSCSGPHKESILLPFYFRVPA